MTVLLRKRPGVLGGATVVTPPVPVVPVARLRSLTPTAAEGGQLVAVVEFVHPSTGALFPLTAPAAGAVAFDGNPAHASPASPSDMAAAAVPWAATVGATEVSASVGVVDDAIAEQVAEGVRATLSVTGGATLGAPGVLTGVIEPSDVPVTPPPAGGLATPAPFNAPLQPWHSAPNNRLFVDGDGTTVIDLYPGYTASLLATPPRQYINSTMPVVPAAAPRVVVSTVAQWDAAWSQVRANRALGGEILLADALVDNMASGLVALTEPARAGLPGDGAWGWVVIRPQTEFTPGGLRRYPAVGVRVTPEYASRMPVILSHPSNGQGCVRADNRSWGVRYVGVRFDVHPSFPRLGHTPAGEQPGDDAGVQIGALCGEDVFTTDHSAGNANSYRGWDRCYFDPRADEGVQVGKSVFSRTNFGFAVDSWCTGPNGNLNGDSQSFCWSNCAGPIKLVNNYAAGCCEPIAIGGRGWTDNNAPQPEDLELRLLHTHIPPHRLRNHPAYAARSRNIGPAVTVQSTTYDQGKIVHTLALPNGWALPAWRGRTAQARVIGKVLTGPAAGSFFEAWYWQTRAGVPEVEWTVAFAGHVGLAGYLTDPSGQTLPGPGDQIQFAWAPNYRLKLLFETKSARYVCARGNVFEGHASTRYENQMQAVNWKGNQYERTADVGMYDSLLLDVLGGVVTVPIYGSTADQLAPGGVQRIDVDNVFVMHADRHLRGVNFRENGCAPYGIGWVDLHDFLTPFRFEAPDSSATRYTVAVTPGARFGDLKGAATWFNDVGDGQVVQRPRFTRGLFPAGVSRMWAREPELWATLAFRASGAVWTGQAVYAESASQVAGNDRWPNGIDARDAGMTTLRVSNDQAAAVFTNPVADLGAMDWSVKAASRYKAVAFGGGLAADAGCDWSRLRPVLDFARASELHAPCTWKV